MLKHIVLWKLTAEEPGEKAAAASTIIDGLTALVGVVPSIRSLSVGTTVVTGPNHWDLGLIAEFDDEAGLQAYQVDPSHQAIAAIIRSLMSQQSVVDFVV